MSLSTTESGQLNETLRRLLDSGLQFDPSYLPSMNADHLPMTLVAMAKLGANTDQLIVYQENYRQRLRAVQKTSPAITSIEQGRGRGDGFFDLRELLHAQIATDGYPAVVKRYLPQLLSSMAAGAFHPIIRLGFAITVEHEGEVASALAYWMTSSFQPQLVGTSTTGDLKAILLNLEPIEIEQGRFGDGLRELNDAGRYPAPVSSSIEACAKLSLELYQGTRNFFALHLVTASQAARVCSDFVEEDDVVRALTSAIQASYFALGAPDFSTALDVPKQLDEEHNIKYVYACAQEYARYQEPKYRQEILDFVAAGLAPKWILIPS